MPSPAKMPRLIRTQHHRQSPGRSIAIREILLHVAVERIVGEPVLRHDFLPGFVVRRLLRPLRERESETRLVRGSVAQGCRDVAGIDGREFALVELWTGVLGAAVPAGQLWPESVVGQWTVVARIELLVRALLFQRGPFAQVACEFRGAVLGHAEPGVDVAWKSERFVLVGLDGGVDGEWVQGVHRCVVHGSDDPGWADDVPFGVGVLGAVLEENVLLRVVEVGLHVVHARIRLGVWRPGRSKV